MNIKNILNKTTFLIISIFILTSTIYSIVTNYKINNRNNLFRIHVVANSNNINDQIIKHKINENLLNNINSKYTFKNSYDYLNFIKKNIKKIENNIDKTLKENNCMYSYKIKLGNINYENKDNIKYSMNKGNYCSMQILLGKANGKNVWNLIFPNKETIKKLKYLNNILPGINNIY